MQTASEVLNEAQNAVAGFRRVLDVIDTEPDVRDPALADPGARARAARRAARRPLRARLLPLRAGRAGWPCDDVDLTIEPRQRVAIVGETGSGKTTFAKLVTRLMDPVEGRVLLGSDAGGWVPLDEVAFASLRSRVVMVPQDGFLFDATVADNVRYGRPGHDRRRRSPPPSTSSASATGWTGCRRASATPVGQRGESLSAGERQLVAVARAYVADPDLLVLDEATSAVDPATELRLTRALDTLTDGRTTLTIAHRLSTAERADEVLVVDAGRVVQRGTHAELVDADGPYARLHASWRRSSAGEPARPVALSRRGRLTGPAAVLGSPACRRPPPAPGSRRGARPARRPGAGRRPRRPARASAAGPFAAVFGLLVAAEDLYLAWLLWTPEVGWDCVPASSRCCSPSSPSRPPRLVLLGRRRAGSLLAVAAALPLAGDAGCSPSSSPRSAAARRCGRRCSC